MSRERDGLTRRSFLRGAGAGTVALAGLGVPAAGAARLRAAAVGGGLSLASRADPRLLPSARQIRRQVEAMVALGPRLTGTPAQNAWIDQLEEDWSSAGVSVSRDHFTFTRWLAQRWSLEVLDGAGAGRIPISSPFPYTAPTGPGGVTAPLVYVGPIPLPSIAGNPLDLLSDRWALARWRQQLAADVKAQLAAVPGGVKGNIVLLEAPVPPLAAGDFTPFVTYTQDSTEVKAVANAADDYKRIWILGAFIQYVLEAIEQAGPIGAVFILDASRENAAGQYTPYAQPLFSIPAVYVDRDTGTKLRAAAQGTPRTRLELTAEVAPKTPSDSLVGVLPGDGSTDEVLILNTHTDGQNAFEENGGIALTAIARYFAALGRKSHRRTLVFSAFTGHFGPGLPQAQGFVNNHPDLIKRAAASVTVEHFGATEWLDNARGYYPTGRPEIGSAWHSQTPIAVPLVESMRANGFDRTSALRPIGDYMVAVGGAFHKAGVPTISYIAGPNYLVDLDRNNHIDKLDSERFAMQVRWLADITQRLDQLPKAALQAGDTAVVGAGRRLADSDPVRPARRQLSSFAVTLLAVAGLAGPAAAAPSPAASQTPAGCDSSLPVVAHRAGGAAVQLPAGATLPLACADATGYATSESSLAVTGDGSLLYSPAQSENAMARSTDAGASWRLTRPAVEQPTAFWNTVDPFVLADRRTGWVFWSHATGPVRNEGSLPQVDPLPQGLGFYLAAAQGFQVYGSSDGGRSWTTADYSTAPTGDWEKLAVGPPPASSGAARPSGYPDVVYLCANSPLEVAGPGRLCYKSLDGGRSFTIAGFVSPSATEPADICQPLDFNIPVVDLSGALFQPATCTRGDYVAVSRDEGSTYTWLAAPAPAGDSMQLAVDDAGNLYAMWPAGGLVYLSVSRNHGQSWGPAMMVSGPHLSGVDLPEISAGAAGNVAVAYYASTNPSAQLLTAYITQTRDALAAQPLFFTGALNDPARPSFHDYSLSDAPRTDFIGGGYDRSRATYWAGVVKQLGPPDAHGNIPTVGEAGTLRFSTTTPRSLR